MVAESQSGSDPRLEALLALVRFTKEHDEEFIRDEPGDQLLVLTTMRSCNTTLAIHNLLVTDSIEQAQMLCRPLFEDTVVIHWLVMQDDPTIERFFDQQDALLVREHDYVTGQLGLPFPDRPRLAAALSRRDELRRAFGQHAERAWWDARSNGSRIGLARIITELESHEPFHPRLHGGAEPALRIHYALANRWAELQLHHMPDGLPFALTRDGVFPRDRETRITVVAETAFWAFGQTIYVQLTYGSRDPDLVSEFNALFMETFNATFADGMSDEEVQAELAEARASLATDPPDPET